MISITNLTKKYNDKVVVDNLTFEILPGLVTGFLGVNGAGKSTTMKMILGLTIPDNGEISVFNGDYTKLDYPLTKVGAFIDSNSMNPKYTAVQHLEIYASAIKVTKERVIEVLECVGLTNAKDKRISDFSLGMKQRLGIATAIIGNPDILILDEPFNGLDVEGIVWLRALLKELAREGKTIFLSSHLMSEMHEIIDRIVVIAEGKLIANMSLEEMTNTSLNTYVKVVSERCNELKQAILTNNKIATIIAHSDNELHIRNIPISDVGEIACAENIALHELTLIQPSLEKFFIEVTNKN